MPFKTIRFVLNPISGAHRKPEKLAAWIKQIFDRSGKEYEIAYTGGPGEGTRLAAEAVEQGVDLVVAVGGDGTINEIGRALVKTGTALGVVPAGSGNGFARNFNIPLNQQKAIRLLLNPRLISIDVGQLNSHYFFNVAGSGLDADISQEFENFGRRGPLPYFLTGTRSFIQFRPQPVKIWINNRELNLSPLLLSIANAPQYGNGAVIAPNAVPDDGFLDLVVLEPMPLWQAASHIFRLFNGTIHRLAGYQTYRADQMIIERQTGGTIHTDGNPHPEKARLEIKTLSHALTIAVPR